MLVERITIKGKSLGFLTTSVEKVWGAINLATKINLILVTTFSVGLGAGGYHSYLLTEDNALRQVTDQAELIMQEALAVRSYNTQHEKAWYFVPGYS